MQIWNIHEYYSRRNHPSDSRQNHPSDHPSDYPWCHPLDYPWSHLLTGISIYLPALTPITILTLYLDLHEAKVVSMHLLTPSCPPCKTLTRYRFRMSSQLGLKTAILIPIDDTQ